MQLTASIPKSSMKHLNELLKVQKDITRKDAREILVQQVQLFGKEVVKNTIPTKQDEGKKHVQKDYRKAVQVLEPKNINALRDEKLKKRIKKLKNKGDKEGLKKILGQWKVYKGKDLEVVDMNIDWHERSVTSGKDGNVTVPKKYNRLTLNQTEYKRKRRTVEDKVGKLKSTWLPLIDRFKVKFRTPFVIRHRAYGYSKTQLKIDKNKPNVRIINTGHPYNYLIYVTKTAMRNRVEKMKLNLLNIMARQKHLGTIKGESVTKYKYTEL